MSSAGSCSLWKSTGMNSLRSVAEAATTSSRWSARFGFEKTGKQILEKAKSGCNGRYVAVNLNNYHTIEFRLFRGTLKYSTFIATLQMVNHICDAAISLSEEASIPELVRICKLHSGTGTDPVSQGEKIICQRNGSRKRGDVTCVQCLDF